MRFKLVKWTKKKSCVLGFSLCSGGKFYLSFHLTISPVNWGWKVMTRDKGTTIWENMEFLAENPFNWQCNVYLMFSNFNPDFILWSFSIYTFCLSFSTCRPVSFCTQRSTKRGLTSSASSIFTHQTLLRWVDNGVKGGDSGDGRDDGDDRPPSHAKRCHPP